MNHNQKDIVTEMYDLAKFTIKYDEISTTDNNPLHITLSYGNQKVNISFYYKPHPQTVPFSVNSKNIVNRTSALFSKFISENNWLEIQSGTKKANINNKAKQFILIQMLKKKLQK